MFATDQIFHLNLSICPAYVLGSPISRSWAGILAPPVALAGACKSLPGGRESSLGKLGTHG